MPGPKVPMWRCAERDTQNNLSIHRFEKVIHHLRVLPPKRLIYKLANHLRGVIFETVGPASLSHLLAASWMYIYLSTPRDGYWARATTLGVAPVNLLCPSQILLAQARSPWSRGPVLPSLASCLGHPASVSLYAGPFPVSIACASCYGLVVVRP
jgi:hypothetical protein